jgi:excisionase family DNA binding protein
MKFRRPDQMLMPWHPRYDISTERAAEMLHVSPDTIQRMCQSGELTAYKLRDLKCSPWHVNRDSVESFIDEMRKRNGLEEYV